MFIPEGYTEEQLIKIIDKIARKVGAKFKFGYLDQDDLVQQAVIIIIESKCLEKYDPNRPLENFLANHLRKRFYNFKRDNFTKPTPPCHRCPLAAYLPPDGCAAYKDKMDCTFFRRWETNNKNKMNIMHTIPIDVIRDYAEKNASYEEQDHINIDRKNVYNKLLEKLSIQHRKWLLMVYYGVNLKTANFRKLKMAVEDILNG